MLLRLAWSGLRSFFLSLFFLYLSVSFFSPCLVFLSFRFFLSLALSSFSPSRSDGASIIVATIVILSLIRTASQHIGLFAQHLISRSYPHSISSHSLIRTTSYLTVFGDVEARVRQLRMLSALASSCQLLSAERHPQDIGCSWRGP